MGREPAIALANCAVHRPPQLAGVEVVVAGRAVRSFPTRLSDGLGICVKYGGAHDVLVEDRRVVYPADAVSVRSPGSVWASETGRHGFVSIDVAPERLPSDWAGAAMAFVGRQAMPDVAATARRLARAEDALAADEILTGLLDAVPATPAFGSDAARDPEGPDAAVADACEFLRANVDTSPGLDAAADAAGVSKFTLLRRFRRVLGTTPHAYLVMVRVNRAQSLLARGVSPAEAAAVAGFSDQAHMGRWFRRLLGVTPAGYRRQARTAISFQTAA